MMPTDPDIQTIFDEFAENLSNFLTAFIHEENPNVVVMGGNIAQADIYFLPSVIRNLQHNNINIPIRKSTLGEHATLLGSAALWITQPKFSNA